jgi:endonuclease/exonuclease/phosphatase family metal-dependent hydrolase
MDLVFGEANGPLYAHVAWLTRLPVARAENHRLPALAKTLLEVDAGSATLFATHLASRHEIELYPQTGEVRAILDVLRGRSDAPHVLVGDFNALRLGDPVGVPPPGVLPRGDALPGAPRRTLGPLLAAGFLDCYRAIHRDDPGFTYTAQTPWLRLDYVFASPQLAPRLRSCEVVREAEAARASDHLPLCAEFD